MLPLESPALCRLIGSNLPEADFWPTSWCQATKPQSLVGFLEVFFLTAVATGALCSFAPAFAALRTNLTESLKEGVRTVTGASSHTGLRSALVVSEIAIALVLQTISGAFLRSFQKMRAVDPGFRPDHVLVAGYQLPLQQYSTDASVDSFNDTVVDRLESKPGVIAH